MAEEAVPVVLAAHRVVRPVRGLGVDEDDPRVAVRLVAVRPDVPVRLGAVRVGAGLLEPRMVRRGVVHDEVDDDADPALVRRRDERAEVLDRAVVGVDPVEVGDVVAAVPERRRIERQQPDAVDPEPLQVVELLLEAAEVAGAVVVPVEERARVDLVEDRRLEPQRIALEPVAGLARPPDVSTRSSGTSSAGAATQAAPSRLRRHAPIFIRCAPRARGRRSCGRSASGSARRSAGRARELVGQADVRAARRRRPRAGGADRG